MAKLLFYNAQITLLGGCGAFYDLPPWAKLIKSLWQRLLRNRHILISLVLRAERAVLKKIPDRNITLPIGVNKQWVFTML